MILSGHFRKVDNKSIVPILRDVLFSTLGLVDGWSFFRRIRKWKWCVILGSFLLRQKAILTQRNPYFSRWCCVILLPWALRRNLISLGRIRGKSILLFKLLWRRSLFLLIIFVIKCSPVNIFSKSICSQLHGGIGWKTLCMGGGGERCRSRIRKCFFLVKQSVNPQTFLELLECP